MLELKGITKTYIAGTTKVEALRGIDIQFRESEFVSILGQSGCGKTTLLNIIGGLDQYTSGDLLINGISTKDYKDRDWDSYRNYKIGFVFQSYNLIPHQTVLQNVELALSLSGVSKKESKKRATEALDKVGLSSQLNKRPNELSGGQMQRVAIARAIVNNPDIILADEPTGALDSETSVQVMNILKELSKEKLVIMVTHNAELAEEYSTRIIRALDGRIISDSNPYEIKYEKKKTKEAKKAKKPSLSFLNSFTLSLKNLFTKKGRTTLTAFAGSIGIIGIALIYAVSNGTTSYINLVQEDTLASYPLTLEKQSYDMTSLIETFMGKAESTNNHNLDAVYQKTMMYDLINSLNNSKEQENDLKSFKEWLENERKNKESELHLDTAISGIQYTYNFSPLIYTKNVDGKIIQSDSKELMKEILIENMGMDVSNIINSDNSTGIASGSLFSGSPFGASDTWQELLSSDTELISPLLKKQYDVIYGQWPNNYNEIVLVVDEKNELSDLTLYALGLKTKDEISKVTKAAMDGEEINYDESGYSYEDICSREFRTILNSNCYSYNEDEEVYQDTRDSNAGLKYLYDNAIPLKVTGIIRQSKDSVSGMLSGSICYTKELTNYIIENNKDSEAINSQLEDKNVDIFTNLPFKDNDNITDKEKATDFKEYINELSEDDKANAYIKIKSIPDEDEINDVVDNALEENSIDDIREQMKESLAQETSINTDELNDYINDMSDEDLIEIFTDAVKEQYKSQYANAIESQMNAVPSYQLAEMLDSEIDNYSDEECAKYYDNVLEFSESTYENNLEKLGYVDIDNPSSINLYASTFENKEVIEDGISAYNNSVDDLEEIHYTDYVGIMMSSITTIINAITYVLIAFVAVSLIVSSIMIGVITLISVQERTKEIGILRSIGASKRNVSTLFNAETVIIGFLAGVIGVGITYLLCIPINIILHNLTGIMTLSAYLDWKFAIILILVSVLLTLIAGIIPSRSAAKKDPVVALRTE